MELTLKNTNAIAPIDSAWGAAENLEQGDIPATYLILMQSNSELVKADEANAGDWVLTGGNEVIGGKKKPAEIIVIDKYNTWSLYSADENGIDKKIAVEPYNRTDAWEGERDGKKFYRRQTFNYICLVKGRESEGPVFLLWNKGKKAAAQKLNEFISRMARKNLPSAAYTFKLGCELVKTDFGSHLSPTVEIGSEVSKETLAEARSWYELIRDSKVKFSGSTPEDEVEIRDVEEEPWDSAPAKKEALKF